MVVSIDIDVLKDQHDFFIVNSMDKVLAMRLPSPTKLVAFTPYWRIFKTIHILGQNKDRV